MILRLVWASVRQRSGRSALLLGGYAIGVAATIVLLSVGQAMVNQATDRKLLGGGDLIVLPAGIDLETLRTGGPSSMYFAVEQAAVIYRGVLDGPRFEDRIAAAAPWIDDALLYLEVDGGLTPISAGATIPDLAAEMGAAPDLVAGSWGDIEANRNWRTPSTAEFLSSIDGLHLPAGSAVGDTSWAEWHYFNVLLPDSGWVYLTYMIGGAIPDGRWLGRLMATRVDPRAGTETAYSQSFDPVDVAFAEGQPDLAIGPSSVTVQEDGSYRLLAEVTPENGAGGSDRGPLTVDLTVSERTRRYLYPVELGSGDFVSGYVVPMLDGSAAGTVCEGARCQRLVDAQTYHDHNWGIWSKVTWEWGQARAGPYSMLYGRVGQEGGDAESTYGGRFLYLADELGFAGLFAIREFEIRWSGDDGGAGSVPEAILLSASNQRDSLAMSIGIEHIRRTPVPIAEIGPDAILLQMRGRLELSGNVFGIEVQEVGDGFFETWTR